MKKQLLFFVIATMLIACSKETDEPKASWNRDKDTENTGDNENENNEDWTIGDLNQMKFDWVGVFNEIIIYGSQPFQNNSPGYREWMAKYGKDFDTSLDTTPFFTNKTISGIYEFEDYTFSDIDEIALEYANFTIENTSVVSNDLISDSCNALITCKEEFLDNSAFAITYSNISLVDSDPLSSEWQAKYIFVYNKKEAMPSYTMNTEIMNWIYSHNNNLSYSEEETNRTEFQWTFNLSSFDLPYIIDNILPFVMFTNYNSSLFCYVYIYHKEDRITRQITGVNY